MNTDGVTALVTIGPETGARRGVPTLSAASEQHGITRDTTGGIGGDVRVVDLPSAPGTDRETSRIDGGGVGTVSARRPPLIPQPRTVP